MGIFFNHYIKDTTKKGNIFQEAEVDGQDLGGEETTDYTTAGAEDDQQNIPAPGDGEPMNQEPAQDTDAGGGDEPTDYTTMGSDDGGDDGTDQNSYDGGTDGPEAGGQDPKENQPIDSLKQQEEELFNNLTPEQLDIKHKELKSCFLQLYNNISMVLHRMSEANTSDENTATVTYIFESLTRLKDMVSDYVNDVYKTKSYVENLVNYNRFLAVLNGINKMLEELSKKID